MSSSTSPSSSSFSLAYQEADMTMGQIAILSNALDTWWLLFGACLVFFMQTGFCMLEAGTVSVKNTKNILIKNIGDAVIGAIVWWLLGYGVAYGTDNGQFIGGSNFGLAGNDFENVGVNSELTFGGNHYNSYGYAFWFFQWAFAATAATIVSGAVAERVSFSAYIIYSIVLTAFIYPVVVHWAWDTQGWASSWRSSDSPGNGLLYNCGSIDFAGSGVVHMVGGMAALVACIITGPRIGRFNEDGTSNPLPQQSAVLQTMGGMFLWFGWYGFNGVSSLYIATEDAAVTAAKAMVMTTIGASAGAVSATVVSKITLNYWDHGMSNNGLLAGLVAITAGCAVIEPYGAFIIGSIAGVIYPMFSKVMVKFQIDDVVDAVAVHLACGVWGVFSTGFFATKANYANAYYADRAGKCCGVFYGGNGNMLGANITLICAILAWVAICCVLLFIAIDQTIGMRVPRDVELAGMDDSKHGGQTYPEDRPKATVSGGLDDSKNGANMNKEFEAGEAKET